MPIRLTSEQLDAILLAAKPLTPDRRQAFITQVADALQHVPVVGPGVLHRTIAAAQRQHFDPPNLVGGTIRWSR